MMVAVGVILFLTTQNIQDNARISEGFREGLIEVYEQLGLDDDSAWWNDKLAVRRLGHVIEYGLLGIASAIAVGDTRSKGVAKVVGLCVGISILDQVLKIFVPIRHFDVVDIGYDAIGALMGILITKAIIRLIKRA